jgi:hypothetical protein
VGAKDEKRFDPRQDGSTREQAHEVATGRGEGNHHGLAKQQEQVAHGGSNPHAGPKPKTAPPGQQKTPPGQEGEKPGPQNDKPKPGLTPLLPSVPGLEPPRGERIGGDKEQDPEKPKKGDDEPHADQATSDPPTTDPPV